MNSATKELPFFVTAPGHTDVLLVVVTIVLVLVVIGFGALYFTVQAWPDRLAKGASKVQLQIVGILGLLSLLTFNNVFWIAGLLLAAVRIPDIVTPLWEISRSLTRQLRPTAASSRSSMRAPASIRRPRPTTGSTTPAAAPETREGN